MVIKEKILEKIKNKRKTQSTVPHKINENNFQKSNQTFQFTQITLATYTVRVNFLLKN